MSDEFATTQEQFKCACLDSDPIVCFYLRYNKNPLELDKSDICECPCHNNYDPLDYDEDEAEERNDYELMKQLADNEVMAREKDARARERELRMEYPYKYSDEGE